MREKNKHLNQRKHGCYHRGQLHLLAVSGYWCGAGGCRGGTHWPWTPSDSNRPFTEYRLHLEFKYTRKYLGGKTDLTCWKRLVGVKALPFPLKALLDHSLIFSLCHRFWDVGFIYIRPVIRF